MESITDLLGDMGVVHQTLMFDELKVEERLRWDDKTNMIQGVCQEHGKVASLEYTLWHEVDLLFDMLEQEKVHFSTNVCKIIKHLILDNQTDYSYRRWLERLGSSVKTIGFIVHYQSLSLASVDVRVGVSMQSCLRLFSKEAKPQISEQFASLLMASCIVDNLWLF